jgi:hypothetical protein
MKYCPNCEKSLQNYAKTCKYCGSKQQPVRRKISVPLLVIGVIIFLLVLCLAFQPPKSNPKPTPTATPTSLPETRYVSPLLKIWSGVKVYYGSGTEKTYAFEILGGSEDCPLIPSGRGVKVRYPDGTEEWKDREALVSSGTFFVLSDDPAIVSFEWYEYSDCP